MNIKKGDLVVCVNDSNQKHSGEKVRKGQYFRIAKVLDGVDYKGNPETSVILTDPMYPDRWSIWRFELANPSNTQNK